VWLHLILQESTSASNSTEAFKILRLDAEEKLQGVGVDQGIDTVSDFFVLPFHEVTDDTHTWLAAHRSFLPAIARI